MRAAFDLWANLHLHHANRTPPQRPFIAIESPPQHAPSHCPTFDCSLTQNIPVFFLLLHFNRRWIDSSTLAAHQILQFYIIYILYIYIIYTVNESLSKAT